ncbi:hypothetical protein KQI36_15955 [Clostridium senegalense]|uniref:hypothetical protein n=1 Tax=Clostridium senegalense TaxID=1465809 RepID=UPI001295247B|nr:hypothetical protein [Clostridium senegalense]MBU5228126.1 hypothetical protein [Clostridium senegalense]MPU17349.1 hypothetical protein [Acinetobacter baumannii]
MPNILSKLASLIMAVLLIVIMMYDRTNYVERYVSNQVNVSVNRFQKEARRKGYVDKELYDNLLKELNNTGRLYDVKILHRDIKYYPVANVDENGYKVEMFRHNEKEILDRIYNKNKIYLMRYGDDFQITVNEKGESANNILWSVLSGDKADYSIFASFGGAVENEIN